MTNLPKLVAELAGMPVDVIVTDGTPAVRAEKEATTRVPIVMATVGDAVASGIVGNLARPGSNITGFSLLSVDLSSKRLELLKEVAPTVRRTGRHMEVRSTSGVVQVEVANVLRVCLVNHV